METKQKLYILIIIIFFIAAISFFVIRNFQKIETNEASQPTVKSLDEKVLNIKQKINPDKCKFLDDKDKRDVCYNHTASLKKDESICLEIIDEQLRYSCQSIIITPRAKQQNDIRLCLEISNKYYHRSECIASGLGIFDEWGTCVQDAEPNQCLEKLFIEQAEKNSNPLICQALSKEFHNACLNEADIVKNNDIDYDGLIFEQEQKYGTDPNNPDTDSDGFLDGEEVKNGYNPLGEGRL